MKPTPTVSLTAEQMLEKLAAALNLSKTEQTLEKLEAIIKERCNSDSKNDRSDAVTKGPAVKPRGTN